MPELTLTARLNTSAADTRRGVVRLHPEALTALGLREWDGIALTGSRVTAAVAGIAPLGTPTGTILMDDVTLSNAGISDSGTVVVAPVTVFGGRQVCVSGSSLATTSINTATLRQALLGKVVSVGDAVSLLPRDLGPGTSTSTTTRTLSQTFGIAWTSELLTVTSVDPGDGPVSIQPNTAVSWSATGKVTPLRSVRMVKRQKPDEALPAVSADELPGSHPQAAKLTEWLSLALDEPGLLKVLGASPRLGVLISGPAGGGKSTMARAVLANRVVSSLDGPSIGALEAEGRLRAVTRAVDDVIPGGVLLITEIDTLLPATAEPVGTIILGEIKRAIETPGVAFIATTAHPELVDNRLRNPDFCDRELALTLPDAKTRKALLELLLRKVPSRDLALDQIAVRTPGFVVADLAALCREASLRAAARARVSREDPAVIQSDLIGALGVIRPLSRSGTEELAIGTVALDDVGDMVETKQALTEAVLWPLRHPDSFARLGIDPPRGVLLYGPPGCGKTFLVRALASTGQLSVHVVKGAELMDKWVGSSERAVRELFARARDSAPSLVFLDEVDALAPRRGGSVDSGVGDRVVAALLTELDGVEPLRDVVVVGATNRPDIIDPALLRPGRLERLVYVPPPDADARVAILSTAARSVPLAKDVDLQAIARDLEGYSAADCSALLREAALAAMRRSVDAAEVSAADMAAARNTVRPSLDPGQIAILEAYARERQA
ncbi:AAA family ATPase [Smaragdicoccus niigatensis]|uniref:AAA family ATPase n=1 Tax=Smaragdicoccus niigatensis TaxID=359359 RepID=UPI000372CA1D|nr:AAA family ATPase [Smaragdicoccus niigatensis]